MEKFIYHFSVRMKSENKISHDQYWGVPMIGSQRTFWTSLTESYKMIKQIILNCQPAGKPQVVKVVTPKSQLTEKAHQPFRQTIQLKKFATQKQSDLTISPSPFKSVDLSNQEAISDIHGYKRSQLESERRKENEQLKKIDKHASQIQHNFTHILPLKQKDLLSQQIKEQLNSMNESNQMQNKATKTFQAGGKKLGLEEHQPMYKIYNKIAPNNFSTFYDSSPYSDYLHKHQITHSYD